MEEQSASLGIAGGGSDGIASIAGGGIGGIAASNRSCMMPLPAPWTSAKEQEGDPLFPLGLRSATTGSKFDAVTSLASASNHLNRWLMTAQKRRAASQAS